MPSRTKADIPPPTGSCRCGLLVLPSLRHCRGFHGRLRSMAGLLMPWPSAECVNCRVLDLELCQADRVGSALQLLDRLGRDGPRCGARGAGRFAGDGPRPVRAGSCLASVSGRRRHRGSAVNGGRRPFLEETRSAIDGGGVPPHTERAIPGPSVSTADSAARRTNSRPSPDLRVRRSVPRVLPGCQDPYPHVSARILS